jgi:iron complex transport system substrate-binding protein
MLHSFVRFWPIRSAVLIPALRAGTVVVCLIWGGAMRAQDVPLRVVSMNLCTDQLAMLLADEGQLVSVSRIASDPRSSAMVQQAAAYPANSGLAEDVFLMKPDLVLAGTFSARASITMLERLGIRVVTFAPAYALEDVADRLTQMGTALGRPERAAEMVAQYTARLAAYRAVRAVRPRAALYYANGYTSGDKTLAGQILAVAGLHNIAAEEGFSGGGIIPLEVLAMALPDAVITSEPYPAASRSEEVQRHPVIKSLRGARPDAALTDSDWVCGTPFVLSAIEDMVTLRQTLEKGAP